MPTYQYVCRTCGLRFNTHIAAEGHEVAYDHECTRERVTASARATQQPAPTYTVLTTNESSSSSVIYEIRKAQDGVVYCTCPAWRMKGGRGSCKHLDAWRLQNFSRPTAGSKDAGLRIQGVHLHDVVEVNSRGDVFLLEVTAIEQAAYEGGKLIGTELLDDGESPTNASARREVDFRDVTRIVIKSERP